ncbi:MAG: hypothetical protein FWC95_03430 [Defluviitaleaceae bacterium]|nr:hypothetical protein [Defluviitaleaceae bacterium]
MNYPNPVKLKELTNLCAPFSVISLVGLSKEDDDAAIKILNELIGNCIHDGTAITSVGCTPACINVSPGLIIASASGSFTSSTYTKEILAATGYNTPLGEVYITRAITGGSAMLAGPSIGTQLEALCKTLLSGYNVRQVYVTGSGERRAFVPSPQSAKSGIVLCVKSQTAATLEKIKYFNELVDLPHIDTAPLNTVFTHIPGAFTDEMIDYDQRNPQIYTVTDFTKIFLTPKAHRKLISRGGVYLLNKIPLISVICA